MSSSSSDSFLDSDKESVESFIECNKKYSNIKTYSKPKDSLSDKMTSVSQCESPIRFTGESIDFSKPLDETCSKIQRKDKVEGWLKSPGNVFGSDSSCGKDLEEKENDSLNTNIEKESAESGKKPNERPKRSSPRKKVDEKNLIAESPKKRQSRALLANTKNKSDILEKFFGTVLTDRVKARFENCLTVEDKQNKNKTEEKDNKIWEPVNKMKNVLKRDKRLNLKKLDISIECPNKVASDESNNNLQTSKEASFTPEKRCDSPLLQHSIVKSPEAVAQFPQSFVEDVKVPIIDITDSKPSTPIDHDKQAMLEVFAQSKLENENESKIHSSCSSSPKYINNVFENVSLPLTHFSLNQTNDRIPKMRNSLKRLESESEKEAYTENIRLPQLDNKLNAEKFNKDNDCILVNIVSEEEINNKDSTDNDLLHVETKKVEIKNDLTHSITKGRGSILKKKIVPFICQGKLYRKIHKKRKLVPFVYKGNCFSSRELRAKDGLNIKINGDNCYASIVIRNELKSDANIEISRTKDAQTSPLHNMDHEFKVSMECGNVILKNNTTKKTKDIFRYEMESDNEPFGVNQEVDVKCINKATQPCDVITSTIERELKENDPFSNEEDIDIFETRFTGEIDNKNVQPISKEISDVLTFQKTKGITASTSNVIEKHQSEPQNQTCKRIRIENPSESSEDMHNPSKKTKSTSQLFIDDNIVVHFESQTQIPDLSAHTCNKENQHASFEKASQESVIEDSEKIAKLKKSINMYEGNENIPSSLQSLRKLIITKKESENIFTSSNHAYELSKTPKQDKSIQKMQTEHFDSSGSVVGETPQKSRSSKISIKQKSLNTSLQQIPSEKSLADAFIPFDEVINEDIQHDLINDPAMDVKKNAFEYKIKTNDMKKKFETPASLNQFTDNVKFRSTPVHPSAKRSLTYENMSPVIEISHDEISFKSANFTNAQLERDFMEQAFQHTPVDFGKSLAKETVCRIPGIERKYKSKDISIACSGLNSKQKEVIQELTLMLKWNYTDNFSDDVTHLIVKVDANNCAQRTLKYVQAVISGCWILSWTWIMECHMAYRHIPEENFEVLDMSGECGPYLSRMSKTKLFSGMTFYCDPPFSVLTVDCVTDLLKRAGGSVVDSIEDIAVKDPHKISILLAEPESTQDDKYTDVCMNRPIVPVNIEWMLDSIGKGKIDNIGEWILCLRTFLPKLKWPAELLADEFSDEEDI